MTATNTLPTLRFAVGDTVVPGDRLGTVRQIQHAGVGTHVQGCHVYASLVGKLCLGALALPLQNEEKDRGEDEVDDAQQDTSSSTSTVSCWIEPATNTTNSNKPLATSRVLKVGQLVLGKVLRITPQNAIVQISLVEGVGAVVVGHQEEYLEGAIRREDIRGGGGATNMDQSLEIGDCFQPGDMVACRVLSLGDSRRYFLSTAETELGVLRAVSRTSGETMIPISWKEMQCPETGIKESRKCAKPGGGGGGGEEV